MMVVSDKRDMADGARVEDAAKRIKLEHVMAVKAGEWKRGGTLLMGLGA
jgi:hypothetical protein